jgi:DNA-binding MarR family transcriptional regulator
MSATRVLKNLETAGLVSRSADPYDRRAKMVQITDKAEPLLAALKSIVDEVETITRGNISAQNWSFLQSMLETARDNNLTAYRDRRVAEQDVG